MKRHRILAFESTPDGGECLTDAAKAVVERPYKWCSSFIISRAEESFRLWVITSGPLESHIHTAFIPPDAPWWAEAAFDQFHPDLVLSGPIKSIHKQNMPTMKVAWIRDSSVPPGQPASGRLNCPCGKAPVTKLEKSQGDVTCDCGKVYSYDGWIINPTTVEKV